MVLIASIEPIHLAEMDKAHTVNSLNRVRISLHRIATHYGQFMLSSSI